MTLISFVPSPNSPFQFQPTLDGVTYTGIITWSLYAKRYYLNLYSLDGTLVLCEALIGSPVGVDLQGISWANGTVTLTTVNPHGYSPLGKMVNLTISGASPDSYNGTRPCQVIGVDRLSFSLSSNPGMATAFGRVDYNINLVASLFSSSLVYRQPNGQIEVSP